MAEFVFWSRSDSDRKTISFCGVSGAVCIKPQIANTTLLCNGFPSLVSAWLRMTFVFYVLNMTGSHSQNLHNVMSGSVIGKPQWRTTLFCNRLDFNQQAGGRCHLLPSVANGVKAPTLKRCLLRECLQWPSLGQNNWPIFYCTWLCNGFPSLVSAWLRMTFVFYVLKMTASHSQNLHDVISGSASRGAKFTKNKNDQWSSAARVSVSKCINPWYMSHSVLPFTIREPRQVCLNCAGLWLCAVWGFRTVQIPLAGRHWYFRV